jgi:hypothetical protein
MMVGAADAMAGALHVALCSCRARIEVFEDQCFRNIGAPFEEPLVDSFQEHQNIGVAKRLVGKFDGVGPSLHRVNEGGQGDARVGFNGINWGVWGNT